MFTAKMDPRKKVSDSFKKEYAKMHTDQNVYDFVKMHGTHFIQEAVYGAKYDRSLFMSVDNNLSDVNKYRKRVVSAGGEAWGFGASTTVANNKMDAQKKHLKV